MATRVKQVTHLANAVMKLPDYWNKVTICKLLSLLKSFIYFNNVNNLIVAKICVHLVMLYKFVFN